MLRLALLFKINMTYTVIDLHEMILLKYILVFAATVKLPILDSLPVYLEKAENIFKVALRK